VPLSPMPENVRVIVIEDSATDAELLLRHLERGLGRIKCQLVDDEPGLQAALDRGTWDVVISDYNLPGFQAPQALGLVRRLEAYLPFIIVSGVIGEETAVEAMRLGADDYVMKNNLARLVPAVERELEANQRRRQAREREQRFSAVMQALARRVITLQEQERRSLAAELHDDVGQRLSALSMNLAMLEKAVRGGSGDPFPVLADSRELLETTGRYVRRAIAGLRPAELDSHGLIPALRSGAQALQARSGMACAVSGSEQRLGAALETALFRVAQEALMNAAKHSSARHVDVVLRTRPGGGALLVADDGRGFRMADLGSGVRSHWGLLLMRERIEAVGGRLRIVSAPGRGTRVVAAWRSAA